MFGSTPGSDAAHKRNCTVKVWLPPRSPGTNPNDALSTDQLESIARVVGAPADPGEWDVPAATRSKLAAAGAERKDISARYPGAEPAALDLLRKLVTLDPALRYDVARCLDHERAAESTSR